MYKYISNCTGKPHSASSQPQFPCSDLFPCCPRLFCSHSLTAQTPRPLEKGIFGTLESHFLRFQNGQAHTRFSLNLKTPKKEREGGKKGEREGGREGGHRGRCSQAYRASVTEFSKHRSAFRGSTELSLNRKERGQSLLRKPCIFPLTCHHHHQVPIQGLTEIYSQQSLSLRHGAWS